ncbi:MAG: 6-carboxytetrahydropterin synthase [Candidatus Thermoplasmatota archaeon]|nr:6-carboxytetrahydropterin synthase [Candidatus Thermoplasmatota archaeon]
MIFSLYREVFFEATHRLMHYRGNCSRLHGHQFRVQVWLSGSIDEKTKILVDFNVIKKIVNRFDHQVILNIEDPLIDCIQQYHEVVTLSGDPTSELLAKSIANDINSLCEQENRDVLVQKIRVWESASCYAEYSIPEEITNGTR